jgi:hypothetical protein
LRQGQIHHVRPAIPAALVDSGNPALPSFSHPAKTGNQTVRKLFQAALLALTVSACAAPQNGILVSPDAEALGGNLFVEKLSGGAQVLVLDGDITPDTSFVFQAVTEQADVEGLVILQSRGGNLLASHQIGRMIKSQRMNTAVIVSCISACVDIFIAGQKREMTEIAELGLHSATHRDVAYEIDRRYWTEFGFARVNEMAYQVPNSSLWVLDATRAKDLRLATAILTRDP